MVRFLNNMDFREHVDHKDLHKLSWLSVPDRVPYFKLLHLFRVRHGMAPKYLMCNFKTISEAHSHNTRGSDYNYVVSRDLSLSQSGFAYTAIKLWNSLPPLVKSIDTLPRFKRDLKEHFLSEYLQWLTGYVSHGFATSFCFYLSFLIALLQVSTFIFSMFVV